jgi:cytochrome c
LRDPDGKLPGAEMRRIAFTQGSGWLEFRWPNPATKRIELKDAYVQKVDDSTMCGSGYYKANPP